MNAPGVLFVVEKWSECDPTHGQSNAHHNYIASFASTGIGPVHTFFFDEHVAKTGDRCDAALLAAVRAIRPDVIVTTLVRGTDLNPARETLAAARSETGAAIAFFNGDTCDEAAIRWTEHYAPISDKVVILDCGSYFPGRVREPQKYLAAWTPQNPALFYSDERERDLGVSFIGSIARYPDRKRAIGLLEDAGIPVARGGGQAEGTLSIEDYAASLRRSRIALNFCRPVFDSPIFQCKGRVFEITLSGALLVEEANPETARFLTSGKHYVAYDTERDLLDKVSFYLEHETDRAELADTGRRHVEQNLSAARFWRLVIDSTIEARRVA